MARDNSAFPFQHLNEFSEGISERDYHASAFLQSIITSKGTTHLSSSLDRENYVKTAFELANTFLKESKKRQKSTI